MPEPLSIFKTLSSILGSVASYVSKYFVQPKIEISWQRITRTDNNPPTVEDKVYTLIMDYEYELRFTNNSEHPAYHLKLTKCDVEIIRQYIDYNLPISPYDSKTYYVNVRRKYRHDKAVTKMPEIPTKSPIAELTIEYANSRGRKFTTTFKPFEPIEERNKFARI